MAVYAFNNKLEKEKFITLTGNITIAAQSVGNMPFDTTALANFGVDANNLADYAVLGLEVAVSNPGGSISTLWAIDRVVGVSDIYFPYITKDLDSKTLSVVLYNEDTSTKYLSVKVRLLKVA